MTKQINANMKLKYNKLLITKEHKCYYTSDKAVGDSYICHSTDCPVLGLIQSVLIRLLLLVPCTSLIHALWCEVPLTRYLYFVLQHFFSN